jgi:hypothetical protein
MARRSSSGRLRRVLLLASTIAALGLLAVGAANAVRAVEKVRLVVGDLVIVGQGGFKPETLPKFHDAPIKIYGGGKLSTKSGDIPPILERFTFELDKHGHADTTGLEVCTAAKLQATDVPAARRACPHAIVGEGYAHAIVKFPEQGPIPASSAVTVFNGPKKNGFDTVLGHAYTTIPVATTFIVPVVIEKIHKGVYGYRTKVKIPKIAGGYGHLVSGRLKIEKKWTFKGKKHSYVNARCETGRLQARAEFAFDDGTLLKGSFLRPCKVR